MPNRPGSLQEEIWYQFRAVLKQELKAMIEQALEELTEHRIWPPAPISAEVKQVTLRSRLQNLGPRDEGRSSV
jgi:hypothetical protein